MNPIPPYPSAYDMLGQSHVHLSNSRPVQWEPCALYYGVGPHGHEFTEIALVQQGPISHHTFSNSGEMQQTDLYRGDVLIIPPGPIHAYGWETEVQPYQIDNIYYLAEWFLWDLNLLWSEGLVPLFFASHLFRRPEALQIWHFQLSNEELAACESELRDISAEYEHSAPSLLFTRAAFFKVLVILARAWHRQFPQGDLHFRPEIWQAIQRVDRCIKEGENFKIDGFAREVGLASGTFSNLFHASTGLSPTEYFGRRRTQHAAHMLLESDLPIGEIAARLGFCDSAHLSRAFQQNQRMSPRAFRTRYRRRA